MDPRRLFDLFYLTLAIYREARGESASCRIAVGYSIMNRVERPKWWGHTVEEVVTKKWQYSSVTDPHDPQLTKVWPLSTSVLAVECLRIAEQVYDKTVPNPVKGADSYHDSSIAPPDWTKDARKVAVIGRITFYDVDHDYQQPLEGVRV